MKLNFITCSLAAADLRIPTPHAPIAPLWAINPDYQKPGLKWVVEIHKANDRYIYPPHREVVEEDVPKRFKVYTNGFRSVEVTMSISGYGRTILSTCQSSLEYKISPYWR